MSKRSSRNAGAAGPVLALEGALVPGGAALVEGGKVIAEAAAGEGRGRRTGVLDAALLIARQAGLSPADLAAVAVDTGPGSFTGIRVALAAAGGLRTGAGGRLPILALDSPRLLAAAAGRRLPVLVAIPWGRLRVLLATAEREGPVPFGPGLVAREALPRVAGLAGREVVLPASAGELPLPRGARPVRAQATAGEAFARLIARGAAAAVEGGTPEPTYLVPPDAIPARRPAGELSGAEVVDLGPADVAAVVAIERESFETPWTAGMVRSELEAPGGLSIGLRTGGRLAGYALAREAGDALALLDIAVAPERRGQGVGRRLLRALAERAAARGLTRIELEVRPRNHAAIRLYVSEGFVFVGRRRRYYPDGEDALLMTRVLARPRT